MKKLQRRHENFLSDLLHSELSEEEVLRKHGVSAQVADKWFMDDVFLQAFHARLVRASALSAFILARCARAAALRLVSLAASDSDESARKACMDVLRLAQQFSEPRERSAPVAGKEAASVKHEVFLSTDQLHHMYRKHGRPSYDALVGKRASKLLEVLAETPGAGSPESQGEPDTSKARGSASAAGPPLAP